MAYPGFRHLGLKVLSVMLAALMWLLVAGEQVVERALRIPLEFTNAPEELELVGGAVDVVEVRVRGSSGTLSRIAAGEMIAVLDLRGARPGRRLLHLGPEDIRTPFGVDVVQVSPSNVSVTLEASAAKVVPVVPEIEGEPRDGFVVGTASADPSTVEVVGPESAVRRVTEAFTEPVSVADASTTVVESVNVGVADPSVRLRAQMTAQVMVSIAPAPAEWAVENVPVRASDGDSVQVTPGNVLVFVRGPRDQRSAGAAAFDASVDTEGLQQGLYQLPVRVIPPARVGVVRVEPPVVRVRVR